MKALLLAMALATLGAPSIAFAQASPSPFTNAIRYDVMRRVTGTISADPDGVGTGNPFLAVRNSYDAAGRLIKVETGTLSAWQSEAVAPASWGAAFTAARSLETSYDAMGRKRRETLREGAAGAIRMVTQYSYDALGRLECTAVRMNPAAFGSLPASACNHSTYDPALGYDRISRTVYDAAGQRLQLREGVGTTDEGTQATWAYNLSGQVEKVIDGNGNRAELVYDGHGRQSCWMFPSTTRPASFNDATPATALASAGALSGVISNGACVSGDYEAYQYDANGNRTNLRKRDGRNIVFAYDALNRVTSKTYPQGGATPVHYGYNLQGLQLFARNTSPTGEGVTNTYDGFGRLASQSINMGGVTRTLAYQFDANSNRTRITWPDGLYVTYGYDGLNRPTLSRENGTIWLTGVSYNPHGLPLGRSSEAGAAGFSDYLYDGVGRPSTLSHNLAGSPHDVSLTYVRNAASQLASVERNNDAYAWTSHYAVNRPYTTDGLNRYTVAGGASFGYDANGNLTSDGSRTYGYDIENRLISASGGLTLTYDPLGRLHQTSGGPSGTTRFLYDGDALVAEYNGSGTLTRRHVHWRGADVPTTTYEGGTRRYLYADHQGSIIAITNSAGAAITINRYDEYGIPAAGNDGRFQYTGQIWLPDLGMYHYKARVYSPTLGRFLQTDPVGYDDQINLYAYVGNDPVNKTDPDGRQFSCPPPQQCPDIPRSQGNVHATLVREADRMSIGVGRRETGTQVLVNPQDPTQVTEVRREPQSGRPDSENPMAFTFNPVAAGEELGGDSHAHPVQTRSDERNLSVRTANTRVDLRNRYPSQNDFRHMRWTNAPFILKNSVGGIIEGYRSGNRDHMVVIREGSQPLGPLPDDLQGIVLDPN